jgi:hypothetical protein
MCCHLIHSAPPIISNSDFFNTIVRQDVYPFLQHSNLQGVQHSNLQGDGLFLVTDYPSNFGSISTPIFDYPNAENGSQGGEQLFDEIKQCLADCQEIVDEQYERENYNWIRAVSRYFNGIRKIVNDVGTYRRRVSNPRTWRDHNEITLLLE